MLELENLAVGIFEEETLIDDDAHLYLFTYSPNPKELPQSDFRLQHEWAFPLVVDLLRTVSCGIACVESTQMGIPHYHGWYQVDLSRERIRIIAVKMLQRYGILKITKSKGHYRINSYTGHGNCLAYYKKEVGEHLELQNPIFKTTESTINWSKLQYLGFFDKHIDYEMEDKLSNREFYKKFYEDSI